jgi:hypothetical protein
MEHDILGPFWPPPRELVDACYTTMEPMSPLFQETQYITLSMEETVSVECMVGFVPGVRNRARRGSEGQVGSDLAHACVGIAGVVCAANCATAFQRPSSSK